MDNGFILLTETQLKTIVENAFVTGVKSHCDWEGQPDTCWSNINKDKKEYVDNVIKTWSK